ncbi:MAG TPA: glycosyltransferase family 39 protein [Terriglobales bacterium]|nr:glycosyltransferase family 39 protein [Terriglobales bacterium]
MDTQVGAGNSVLPKEVVATSKSVWSSDLAVLGYLAAGTVVVHLLTGGRYGFHRDELATLDDARHLAWGYVAYPPVTPFFARLSLVVFGTSLAGFRVFAALAQALAVLLTGLMARELGGRRGAQLVAAVAATPFCLGAGALMQYVSFDYLCWVLVAYFVLRLLRSDDPRWWLAIGSAIGLGMMSKYTMVFLVAGLVVGVVITDARRYLTSKWLWCGVALSLLIFLPNLIWQAQHHFISLEFLRHIHARDVRIGRTKNFLPRQLELTMFGFPLAMAGIYYYLLSKLGKRFRVLGWMYLVPLILFVIAKGRWYYLGAGYPMLYAAGSVWGEQWLESLRPGWARAIRAVAWTLLVADVLVVAATALPIAPIQSGWWKLAVRIQGDLREEIGWRELVETAAKIRDSLPEEDRTRLGILAGNYGEAGAINLYGPQYGLPTAISGINSFWERGYGDPPPETLIVIGISGRFLDRNFTHCELVGHTWNRYGVRNEETEEHPDIFVCRGLRKSWPEFWKDFRYYG